MGTRFKLTEINNFIKTMKFNINSQDALIQKKDKINCCKRVVRNLLLYVWNSITALFIYPIWYLFKTEISRRIYIGTSWEEISNMITLNKTSAVKEKLLPNGKFLFWLWSYGDLDYPLEGGGLPNTYKNNFWNRFYWSAIRNPRFNFNYLEFRTGKILEVVTVIDNRNSNHMHKSFGIGDSPDGVYFKWMKDDSNKWYFIYEDNNKENLFYIGYTGLLKKDLGKSGGRFETGYRKTDSTYLIPE